ncbi:PAS domain S-box protein [Shewanella morhuae]|uniref:Sensory/regulatory protein RpfC n=1 Tax=Shewanella morhuae TaxID=365591 RepID=A0A380B2C7_9GAMM|nr:PAS domain S-box protein [Shewanella morhuae]SUI90854.1 Signal transduction histidine-protein kinase BarA [Shewanella morhuae]
MRVSMSYKNASKLGLFILLIGVTLSAVAAWWVQRTNTQTIAQALQENTEQIGENVINRMTLYQYGLRGVLGTIVAAGEHNISRAGFGRYSLIRDVEQEFPGARGFGFIRRVARADEVNFLTRVRQHSWPDFMIQQLAPNDGERYVIEYIEPIARNQAAVGLDVASEPYRKQAADAALLSGEARLSAPITLVQAEGKTSQSFLILLPIYRTISVPKTEAERLSAGYGWSFAPLVTNEVLTGLALDHKMTKLLLSDVTQASDPIPFFETQHDASPLSPYRYKMIKEIFGRQWQIEAIAYPAFIKALHLNKPSLVFIGGSVFSLLLGGLIAMWSLNLQRKQQVIAEQARRASMLDHSLDAIISYDTDGSITSWNRGAEQLFGYTEEQVLNQSSWDLIIPPNRVLEEQLLFAEVMSGKIVLNRISSHQKQNSSHLSTSTTALPIYDAYGAIVGLSQTIRDISQQQEAEQQILNLNASLEQQVITRTQALQQALLEHQTLLNTINQQLLYSVTDADGIILEVNDHFCFVSGYSREQLVGSTHAIMKSNEHDTAFWQAMWAQITSGESWHGEICNRDQNQQLKWFDTVIGPVIDEQRKIERFVALRIDITGRKLIQIEKNNLGSLLTNVLDAASEMSIIATDTKGVVTIFNRGAERLLGYSAAEVVGKSRPTPLHLKEELLTQAAEISREYGQDIKGFDALIYKAKIQGSETRQWTYVRKDGSQFQVSLSVTAMHDSEGKIIGYLGMAVDISQVLQQQEALITLSNHLSKAAEVAKLGIWAWNVLDNTLEWNDRMYIIYDHPLSLQKQGVTYEHWSMRVHPDDLVSANAQLEAALAGTVQYDPIFRLIKADGSTCYVQAAAAIERDKNGNAVRVIGINIDITEQRQLEATLREAKLEADAASAAKSAFLANMSHEIRTPMNAVFGMLQLMQHTSLSSQQQDYVSKTQTAAKSLLGLLNDILDFSKIDAGKLTLDLQPCSIELLMRDLAVVLSGNHGNQDVEVMFDLDSALPPWLLADQLRLQQILINLAGNALKFTLSGQVTVAINCLARDTDTVTLQIAITDTGIGISDEQIERIFTGFEQAESSTSRRFGGTGLGLAISKRLVELMGGQLQVTSQVGIGSRFWFDVTFPIMTAGESQQIDLSGYRVLVVDDNQLTADILYKVLTGLGCEVEIALGGYSALTQSARADKALNPFDVILMDWRMPELNGLQTAEILRDSHADSRTPLVVMLTAYGHEVIAESQQIKDVPFVNFLTKPVTSQVLAETIINAIEGKTMNSHPKPRSQRLLAGLTILVVEDNQLNRQVIDELLSYEGASVVLAEGGVAGVALVLENENLFDIVIMDMQMPDMDGLEATRLIRSDERFATLPILAMTANASQSDRQDCLDAGMNDHVSKPIDMPLLLPSILQLVGREVATTQQYAEYYSTAAVSLEDEPLLDNIDLILQRFGGNESFFHKIAQNFTPEMNKQLAQLTQATRVADYEKAAAVSHAIKGVASSFGARRLATYSAYLEQQFKQKSFEQVEVEHWVDKLAVLIHQSSQQIATYGEATEASIFANDGTNQLSQPATAVQNIKLELNTLMTLLAENNLEAITRVEQLAESLSGHPQWSVLYTQVQALEFAQALDTLHIIVLEDK